MTESTLSIRTTVFWRLMIDWSICDWFAVKSKPLNHNFHQCLTAWVVQHAMFYVSGTVLSVIMLSLAIIQPKGIMSLCENVEGEQGGWEEERASEQPTSSMEFLKTGSGWRLSACLCSRRGSQKTCVSVWLRESACLHLYVRAGSNYSVLQAFTPTTI